MIIGEDPACGQLCRAYEEFGRGVVGIKEVPAADIGKYSSLKVEPMRDNLYKVTDMVEKPTPDKVLSLFSILGRCVLPPEIFDILDRTAPGAGGEIQLTDAMLVLAREGGMTGVDFTGKRYDMGNKLGILQATCEVALQHPEVKDGFREYLKELAKTVTNRPTVISEKKFGSSWYMPAGDSYVAHLYNDAGADYIFKDLPGAGSTPLAFETVLDKAIHANMWLIKYNQTNDMTYKDLRTEYTPYENFDAFKNRRIYTCNTGIVPYYEEFPIHPDYLLKDLVWVFHPELLPGYTPRYYRKME